MKKSILLVLCAAFLFAASVSLAQCPVVLIGDAEDGTVDGVFHQTFDRVLSGDTCYVMQGIYYVDSLFTLTIEPGTVILGDTATVAAYGGTMVIKRGGILHAYGTEDKPIVFTSRRAPGERASGDWGGLVICGAAPVNQVEPLIEGGIIEGSFGGGSPAGSGNPNDYSGQIHYVRIEYGGYRFQLNNEVNGMTLCGVGAATDLHHIQVSYADDDQYECFGGTVWMHHLVALGATDDDFDSDFGFSGKMQYLFGLKDLNKWDAQGETRGFESDGSGSAVCIQPYTEAVACNATLIGPARTTSHIVQIPPTANFDWTVVIRRCSHLSILNSAFGGYPRKFSLRDYGCEVCTHEAACDGDLQCRGISLCSFDVGHDDGRWPAGEASRCPEGITAWFSRPEFGNIHCIRPIEDLEFADMSSLTNPQPVPPVGGELDTAYTEPFTNPKLAGLEETDYRGAFIPGVPMSQQWTANWTNFDPQNTIYCVTCDRTDVGKTAPSMGEVLGQNYPNPFNPSTVIPFSVPVAGHVTLKVYNVNGTLVATLIDRNMTANDYTVNFQATDLASGVYFYRLVGNGFEDMKKMVLLK
jgi:hypothetical protein